MCRWQVQDGKILYPKQSHIVTKQWILSWSHYQRVYKGFMDVAINCQNRLLWTCEVMSDN